MKQETIPREPSKHGLEQFLRSRCFRKEREVESGGAAIWLASDAASFPNGHILVGHGGALVSGVHAHS